MRRRMISSARKPGYQWDYRIEYVQSPGTAYFLLNEQLPGVPVPPDGRDELWSVKIGCVGTSFNTDRKFFGRVLMFSVATYYGKWRVGAYGPSGWPAVNVYVSANNPIVHELDNSQMRILSGDGGTVLWSLDQDILGNPDPRIYEENHDIAVGSCVGYDEKHFWAQSDGKQTHDIYWFYRKIGGEFEFNLIPCVMGGEVGFYETVSGKFLSSTSGIPFTAGPRVADDGTML